MIDEAAGSTLADTPRETAADPETEALTGRSDNTDSSAEITEDVGASGTTEAISEMIEETAEAAGWLAGKSDTIELIADSIDETTGSAGAPKVGAGALARGMLAGRSVNTEFTIEATDDRGASGSTEVT